MLNKTTKTSYVFQKPTPPTSNLHLAYCCKSFINLDKHDRYEMMTKLHQKDYLGLGEDGLSVGNSLRKNLLLELGVLKLLVDISNNRVGKSLLLSLSNLSLVSNPGVQNRLSLSSKVDLLLKYERLTLKLSSLLGDGKKRLGKSNNILNLRNILNSLLDSLSVGSLGLVQDVLDVADVGVGPILVGRSNGLRSQNNKNSKSTENTGLCVDNVDAVGDSVDTSSGSGSQNTGLGNNAVTGESGEDRRSLSLGILRRVSTDEGTGYIYAKK